MARAAAETESPAARFMSVSVSFGAIIACDRVDLALSRGRIHGILGENGAGKSTLMKVLIGLVMPDSGDIEIGGRRCRIRDPHDAAALGVAMVHQHFSLVESLTVWENVTLGEAGRLDAARARHLVAEISERYGLEVDPLARVGDLSPGVRQRVEVIKCLRRDPDVLILDEPTSALSPSESQRLFAVLRQVVRDENRAVALISHKLDEMLYATDDVTVMRHGAVVAQMNTADTDAAMLARAMLGHGVSADPKRGPSSAVGPNVSGRADAPGGDVDGRPRSAVLEVRDVVVRGLHGRIALDGVSFDVFDSEIVGVAGADGNGQAALVDLLSSLLPVESGALSASGQALSAGRAGAMSNAGIAVIPEDRHSSGCVLEMSVAENLFLSNVGRLARRGVYDRAEMRRQSVGLMSEFRIQADGPDAPFWTLSGGNQQRVVLARELNSEPRVLVAAHPTRGLDVGAIEWVHARLRDAARNGVAVLLVSSDTEEILALSDRVLVMLEGRIVSDVRRADLNSSELAMLVGGAPAGNANLSR